MLERRISAFVCVTNPLARSVEPAKGTARNRPPRGHHESGRAHVKSTLAQRIVAEGLGTAFLLAAVVGSGVMAAKLSGGNGALALLSNTLPTGAILAVLILTFGPISGAHFNPAVSIAFALRGQLPAQIAAVYIATQCRRYCRGLGRACDVRSAAVSTLAHRPHRAGPVAC